MQGFSVSFSSPETAEITNIPAVEDHKQMFLNQASHPLTPLLLCQFRCTRCTATIFNRVEYLATTDFTCRKDSWSIIGIKHVKSLTNGQAKILVYNVEPGPHDDHKCCHKTIHTSICHCPVHLPHKPFNLLRKKGKERKRPSFSFLGNPVDNQDHSRD